NEVADFFDELAECVARCLLRRCAQLLDPPERALAAIQQGADVHGRQESRELGAGSRGYWRVLGASNELRERRRAHPSLHQPLVDSPRPDEVGRFGYRRRGLWWGGEGGGFRRRGPRRCRRRRGRGTRSGRERSRGGAGLDGPERGGEGVELGRERFLVARARAGEEVAHTPQRGGEGGRVV